MAMTVLHRDLVDPAVPTSDAASLVRRACHATTKATLAVLLMLLVLRFSPAVQAEGGVASLLFSFQDIYFLPILLVPMLVQPTALRQGALSRAWSRRETSIVVALAFAIGLVCWIGHRLVLDGYDLSRDEAMANFDAYIFAHGRLTWPIDAAWRPFGEALNQLFMLPNNAHDAWVSAYLPVNAAFRAAVSYLGDASLTAPIFVALGAVSLWRIVLRLWPHSPSSRLVALLLYAGSSQVVVAGMTSYAMSAHLGLDLLWLALFLRGGRAAHAATLVVGFLATGLHQPLFHPLFVLPFLDLLRQERRWALFGYYVVGYGLICGFWLAWPHLMEAHHAAQAAPHVGYMQRLFETIRPFDGAAAWKMGLNLLRFVTWQHVLLLPLLAVGIVVGRADPLARALTIGLALPVVAMAILLPTQGHGYGYRYMHAVIGNACLIGGFGWHWLEAQGLSLRRPFAWATVATFLLVIPGHAFVVHQWAAPYAAADHAITTSGADIAIIDDGAVPWAGDLVVNRPDLSNRPIRLLASQIGLRDLPVLCRKGSVAFFGETKLGAIARYFGTTRVDAAAGLAAVEAAARRANCVIAPR